MEIIIGRHGTQKTLITDATVSRKHCKVTVNADGTYTIENLSPSGTKLDGVEIIRATAKPNSRLQLGQSFSATLVELIGIPQSTVNARPSAPVQPSQSQKQPQVKVFDISHLKYIWDEYNDVNIEVATSQQKANKVRSGAQLLTAGAAMAGSIIAWPIGLAIGAAGLAGHIYGVRKSQFTESPEERQRRREEFLLKWVCPNPECRKPLPEKSFRVLVEQYKECPYCKCKFVVK